MSPHVALYARTSDPQAPEAPIASQLASLHAYAEEHGYGVDADLVFVDRGVSGTTLVRPALDALRDKAMLGAIDAVVVLCPDRLARKHAHQLILVEEFKRLGVDMLFANHHISESAEDQLLLQIQGVIAEFEREKIIERGRRGKMHRAKSGKVSALCQAPYGYVYIRTFDKDETRYEIHPEEAQVVRRVFHLFTVEQRSIGTIATWLTQEGIATRYQCRRWCRSVVYRMLTNPAYRGQAAYRKTQAVPRRKITKSARDQTLYPKHVNSSSRVRPQAEWIYIAVPALISGEVFAKAQQQLEENKKFSSRNTTKNHYLLSGLLHCSVCGYAMYGKPTYRTKTPRSYYRCRGQDGYRFSHGKVCTGRPMRVEVLDDLVWEQTKRLVQHPEIVLHEYSQRMQAKQQGPLELDALLRKKKKECKQQEVEKKRLLDLYQCGTISLEEINERLKVIRARIKKIEEEYLLLEQEEKSKQQQLQLIEKLSDFKEKLTNNLDGLSFADKRKIMRLLVSEVAVDSVQEHLCIKHVIPLDKNLLLRSRGSGGHSSLRASRKAGLGEVPPAAGLWAAAHLLQRGRCPAPP